MASLDLLVTTYGDATGDANGEALGEAISLRRPGRQRGGGIWPLNWRVSTPSDVNSSSGGGASSLADDGLWAVVPSMLSLADV